MSKCELEKAQVVKKRRPQQKYIMCMSVAMKDKQQERVGGLGHTS